MGMGGVYWGGRGACIGEGGGVYQGWGSVFWGWGFCVLVSWPNTPPVPSSQRGVWPPTGDRAGQWVTHLTHGIHGRHDNSHHREGVLSNSHDSLLFYLPLMFSHTYCFLHYYSV